MSNVHHLHVVRGGEPPDEQPSVRIHAFLARTEPLEGCCFCGNTSFENGRALIGELAIRYEVGAELPTWDAARCADVLSFLQSIQPRSGCFCGGAEEGEGPSIGCGYREVLGFLESQLRPGGDADEEMQP